jgi:hypothetical protein
MALTRRLAERPGAGRDEHPGRDGGDRGEVGRNRSEADALAEYPHEKAAAGQAAQLDGQVRRSGTSGVACERPAAIPDVPVQGATGEREPGGDDVRRSRVEQQPVEHEAEERASDTDDEEPGQLTQRPRETLGNEHRGDDIDELLAGVHDAHGSERC